MATQKLVTISKGNTKVGRIPNVSLMPVKDCANCEHCKNDCYALRPVKRYPRVRKAWLKNSGLARKSPAKYFNQIQEYLTKKQPKYFRWHVGGDILSQEYFRRMVTVANETPNTRHLVFTKRHDLDFSGAPSNLSVVLSMWEGIQEPESDLPRAYCDNGKAEIPNDAIPCPGSCENCKVCWHLKDIKADVVFKIH